MNIHFRPKSNQDEKFIYSSWLQSYRELNILKHRTGKIRSDGHKETTDILTGPALWEHDRYYKHQRDIIDAVLKLSTVVVASNPDDHDQIYGYAVYRDFTDDLRILSYLYVKHTFRKMGVARALFENISDCHVTTHTGPGVKKLIQRAGLVCDPFFDMKLIGDIR